MSDREKTGLRGPVKTCTEETIFPAVNNLAERKISTTTEYDANGKILISLNTNPDGSEWISKRTYDAEGRLLKTTWGKLGGSTTEQAYSYDESGRLISIADSSEVSGRTTFHYDEQGRKTKIQSFDPKLFPPGSSGTFGLEGSDTSYGMPSGATITTLYNELNQPTEAQVRDPQGRLVSRIVRNYEAKRRITEEKQIIESPESVIPAEAMVQLNPAQLKAVSALLGGQQGFSGTSYTYDAQNRLIEKRRHISTFSEEVTTITYNDRGDKVEERTASSGSPDASIDEEGSRIPATDPALASPEQSEVRYTYQYDSRGNWMEQTVTYRSSPDEPFKISATYRRKLTYY